MSMTAAAIEAPTQPQPDPRLVTFTGYHSLSGSGVGPGAFLAISTTQKFERGEIAVTQVSLALSIDGKAARNFTDLEVVAGSDDAVDVSVRENGVEAARVLFERAVGGGITGRCSGQSAGVSFEGVSKFNQAPLEVFAGRYLTMDGSHELMTIDCGPAGLSIRFADPATGLLQDRPTFSYVPDMYVLTLDPIAGEAPVSIMLGTGGALGLVAGITGPSGVVYAVSVPPAMPAA